MPPLNVFLTGATGYIGGTVFSELVSRPEEYKVTALSRSESKFDGIRAAGATPLLGTSDDAELLKKAAREFDIVIHVGDSADHLPSAMAFLDGADERQPSQPPLIYIHTSGTGVISEDSHGDVASSRIYTDADEADIDTLDPAQPHREIDLLVQKRAKELGDKASVAIIIPPLIYGHGTGPYNKVSIQVPALIRYAIKFKFVPSVGKGVNWWNNVHVQDLARGYITLLESLRINGKTAGGYYFCETGEHEWKDIYTRLGKILHSKGVVDSATPRTFASNTEAQGLFGVGKDAYDAWGCNSRCKAERLRALGWKKLEQEGLFDLMEQEVDAVIKTTQA